MIQLLILVRISGAVPHKPGKHFKYNTPATFALGHRSEADRPAGVRLSAGSFVRTNWHQAAGLELELAALASGVKDMQAVLNLISDQVIRET